MPSSQILTSEDVENVSLRSRLYSTVGPEKLCLYNTKYIVLQGMANWGEVYNDVCIIFYI